jgi:hypothetical protein
MLCPAGSWDKAFKYGDLCTPGPVFSYSPAHNKQQRLQHTSIQLILASLLLAALSWLLCPAGNWDKSLKHWDLRTPTPVLMYMPPQQAAALATQ